MVEINGENGGEKGESKQVKIASFLTLKKAAKRFGPVLQTAGGGALILAGLSAISNVVIPYFTGEIGANLGSIRSAMDASVSSIGVQGAISIVLGGMAMREPGRKAVHFFRSKISQLHRANNPS